MEVIHDLNDFISILENPEPILNKSFEMPGSNGEICIKSNDFKNRQVYFTNCNFKTYMLFESLHDISIGFFNCTFENSLNFFDCKLQNFTIHEPNKLNGRLNFFESSFKLLIISSGRSLNEETKLMFPKNDIVGQVDFNNCLFEESIHLECNFVGVVSIANSKIFSTCRVFIQNALFNFLFFENNIIECPFNITNTSFICSKEEGRHGRFKNNTFNNNVQFNNLMIEDYFCIEDCKFNRDLKLTNLNNDHPNLVVIKDCSIEGSTYLEECKANIFSIERTHFNKNTYFQNCIFEELYLISVKFDRYLHLQNLIITQLKNKSYLNSPKEVVRKWKSTFRTIKQELQKAENRIDYNRFRSYELEAYYEELNWKNWKDGKDKFILGATRLVTGFDHSWRRALLFTLITGMLVYTLFYISENYYNSFNLSETKAFLSGYFRFLLVTDFYNPLIAEKREYIGNSNTIDWLIFIFGKIVIAFGIYEMIQAFRKFKA